MKFESYADRGVWSAAELVNELTPGWSRGRVLELPGEPGTRRLLAERVEARVSGRKVRLGPRTAEELFQLAGELRAVFELTAGGDSEGAAALVNRLLRRYQAAPQLARHDGESWHLHFHSQAKEAGQAVARGATCAVALAVVLGSPALVRLGVCGSPNCDRVFVDTSKNGSRRFCSPSCLSRTKVAAFRARRAEGAQAAVRALGHRSPLRRGRAAEVEMRPQTSPASGPS